MSNALSLSEFVKSVIAQSKVIRSHDHAVRAKWLAHLLRRLKGPDPESTQKSLDIGPTPATLAEIADRLESACYAGTPEATFETIAAQGATPASALNLSRIFGNLRDTLLYDDSSYNWEHARKAIDSLGANYESISKVACERFGFTWQEREQLRLVLGEYKALPWAKELKAVAGHFAHLSIKDKGLIAYTENDEKGGRDVQKQIKPGRYLKEHYPTLSGADIERLQGSVVVTELQFTSDPDVIEKCYREGPGSCMAGNLGTEKGQHPTRCYGDGDLALAYLLDKNGKCTSRSVVWPAKKVYYNVYGDHARISAALKAHGYTCTGGSWCFQGAKLRKHPKKGARDYYLMASFDGHGLFRLDPDDENFVIVDRNGKIGGGGGGGMHIPTPTVCECGCGKKDLNPLPVTIQGGKIQNWIAACLQKALKTGDIVQCRHTGRNVQKDDTAQVYWRNRELQPVLLASRQTQCIRTANGRYYCKAAYNFVSLDNGEVWELEDLRKAGTHKQQGNGGPWVAAAKEKKKQAA